MTSITLLLLSPFEQLDKDFEPALFPDDDTPSFYELEGDGSIFYLETGC